MATKLAKNGKQLEYLVIRPTFGFDKSTIASIFITWHNDDAGSLSKSLSKFNSWTKFLTETKRILIEEGLTRAEYAWESITNYDEQLETINNHISKLNPKLD